MNHRHSRKRRNIKIIIIIVLLVSITSIVYAVSQQNSIKQDRISKDDKIKTDENREKEKSIDIKQSKKVLLMDDYIDQPRTDFKVHKRPVKVKGIFVNGYAAGSMEKRMMPLMDLVQDTELNAMVIDVKEDDGLITFKCDLPLANEIGSDRNMIREPEQLLDILREKNIFPIARIVAFKDPYLAENRPEYAIKNKDGSLWKYKGISWLNPYNKKSWEYIVDIAKEAVEVGFKEIQFDYIRFEATKYLDNADFGPLAEEKSRMEIIAEFIDYAVNELEPYGVHVSADVFGTIITSSYDAKRIGQNYLEMAKRLDYICPMVYPSHYGYGYFGIPKNKHADLYPYEIIKGSMEASNKKYAEDKDSKKAIVRPWLQAFTASYLKTGDWKTYGGKEIREQIQGAYDAGLEEWILWHSGSKYSEDGLLKDNQI